MYEGEDDDDTGRPDQDINDENEAVVEVRGGRGGRLPERQN